MTLSELRVKVTPGSSRNKILGWMGDELKVAVQAPPEKGKANKALMQFLAAEFNLPFSAIQLQSGEQSPRKVLSITLELEELKKRIDAIT